MKFKITMIIMIMGLALGGFGSAFGSNGFMTPFNNANGTTYNCGVCHTTSTASSSARNQFGADWASSSIGNHSYTITAALAARDSDGDGITNGAEIQANTNPGVANTPPPTGDTTRPTVNTFTIPANAGSLTVSPISLTASDNTGGTGVNGYMVTTSSTAPSATATGWSTTAPANFSFPAGTTSGLKTLYAWAKDGANNVSASRSATVTITITTPDTIAPTVTTFTIPATGSSLAVSPISLTASDNTGGTGVNGYMVTTSSTAPSATATGWTTTAPTSFSFPAGTTSGLKTLYAWAKDGASNVSASRSATVTLTITTPDTIAPTVTTFTIPASASSLTVSPIAVSAVDNAGGSGVNGYMVTSTGTAPAATATGWTTTAPASFSFPAGTTSGVLTLFAWAKDVAGNVSTSRSATVNITTGSAIDVETPEVMEFTLPLTSTSLTVPIVAFRAIDNIDAVAYLITTTPTEPAANAPGWSANPPTSYTFTSGGAKTLYGWAKDAAGNVSESLWDNVSIPIAADTTRPVITSFRIRNTSSSLTVPILQFTARDNIAVTGYLVTATSTRPGSSDSRWSATPPTSYTFSSTGRKRLYPWAKDAAGNVSSYRYSTVNISGGGEEEDD